jgi:hypothetical protein
MSYVPISVAPSFTVPAVDVCPHCKAPLHHHRFPAAGVVLVTYHCARHGDVVPMRSAISNPFYHLEPLL